MRTKMALFMIVFVRLQRLS